MGGRGVAVCRDRHQLCGPLGAIGDLHRLAPCIRDDRDGLLGGGRCLPHRLRRDVRLLRLRRGIGWARVVGSRCTSLYGPCAAMLHGLATGKWSLAACRALLGLGEPGNWPAAARAVAEWFPARLRALGIGIFMPGRCWDRRQHHRSSVFSPSLTDGAFSFLLHWRRWIHVAGGVANSVSNPRISIAGCELPSTTR